MTSKPRVQDETQLVNVKAWSSAADMVGVFPVILYTSVTRGSSPVVGAMVTADVTLHSDNGTIAELLPITLVDDGRGGEF